MLKWLFNLIRPSKRKLIVTGSRTNTHKNDKHCRTCRCFPMTAAERQKAYRERHKAKP